MSCGWEGNRQSGVMCRRFKWFIHLSKGLIFHQHSSRGIIYILYAICLTIAIKTLLLFNLNEKSGGCFLQILEAIQVLRFHLMEIEKVSFMRRN